MEPHCTSSCVRCRERASVEQALIRRRRVEDLTHSVQLTLCAPTVHWRLRQSDGERGPGRALLSAAVSGITFRRCINTNRCGTATQPLLRPCGMPCASALSSVARTRTQTACLNVRAGVGSAHKTVTLKKCEQAGVRAGRATARSRSQACR
jgi:hypothetical protein